MARLDVFRINARQLALDCQSRRLDHLQTRFVVPLLRPADVPDADVPGLHPRFTVSGEEVIMATHLAGIVPERRLRNYVATLAEREYEVQRALDLLTSSA